MTDTQGEYQRMYRNTAGEIEARDAASRRTLTPEERKNQSPDLGDENTVFADSGMSYSEETVIDLSDDSKLARLIAASGNSKYNTIRNYVFELLGGRKFTLSDGRAVIVDKTDAKELAHKANDRKTAEIASIERIVQEAQYFADDSEVTHNKFDYFAYYFAPVRYKGKMYNVIVNIGRAKNDGVFHLYDLTNDIKNKRIAGRLSGLSGPVGNRITNDSHESTIRSSSENVNRYSVDDDLPINLQLVLNGDFDAKSNEVHIGTTSNFLTKEIGAEALDLYMPAEKAYRAMVTEERAVFEGKPTGSGINYHGLGLEGLVDILNASEEPIAAFADTSSKGNKRENRIVLVTDVKAQGGLGVVIEELDTFALKNSNRIKANKAITVYPKGNIQTTIQEAIADNRILYLDEKRSQTHLAGMKGANYPTAARKADFANNIRRFWKNVKWKKSGKAGYTAPAGIR